MNNNLRESYSFSDRQPAIQRQTLLRFQPAYSGFPAGDIRDVRKWI